MEMQLSPRMEDYLEVILDIEQEESVPRVKDIAERMGVSKPTVTAALKTLKEAGLVRHESYGYVELTSTGRDAGVNVQRRHKLLSDFFINVLGIDPQKADEDACSAEHHISDTTLDKLTQFIEFLEQCPRSGDAWLRHFQCYSLKEEGAAQESCEENCREKCMEEMRNQIDASKCSH